MSNETNILKKARDEGLLLTNGKDVIKWDEPCFRTVPHKIQVTQNYLTEHHWQPYTPPKSKQGELEEAWDALRILGCEQHNVLTFAKAVVERLRELER